MTDLAVVIPTLIKPTLGRVLDRLEIQTTRSGAFEVAVVADATAERDAVSALHARSARAGYPLRIAQAERAGASAARNLALAMTTAPLALFLGDDTLPAPDLIAQHLSWHERHPDPAVGVLGHVRWADGLAVTPFMRWLEDGVQFDYPNIDGVEAGWARFYTSNASAKRTLIDRVGGFAERELPFLYEDLDLALRMREHGFRLLYNPAALVEHDHPADLAAWRARSAAIAQAERRFIALHPGFAPYFRDRFTEAIARPPVGPAAARLSGLVPRRLPLIGPRVWGRADLYYRQQLAGPFLRAWDAQSPAGPARPSPAGSPPGGPK
jgi:GT2 family glycosyltransferase